MTNFVVDASVAVKWYLPEPHSPQALTLVNPSNELWAPDLIFAELGNVCWKRAQRGELIPAQAHAIVRDFLASPLRIEHSQRLLQAAWDIAIQHGRSVYDSLYLALACTLDIPLVTADQRFFNAMQMTPEGRRMVWVGAL